MSGNAPVSEGDGKSGINIRARSSDRGHNNL